MTTKYDSQCEHKKYDVFIYNYNTQNINKDTKLQTYIIIIYTITIFKVHINV